MSDLVLYFFFFFKQKTAYEMRISDWSSDVCSSDLTSMKISKLTLLLGGFSLAFASLSAVADSAASYPDKPVRLVVPYTPGGFNDTLARTASEYLTKAWDQSVVEIGRAHV